MPPLDPSKASGLRHDLNSCTQAFRASSLRKNDLRAAGPVPSQNQFSQRTTTCTPRTTSGACVTIHSA